MIGYVFQNNRSSAPPIVMMDGEASEGYLLFWLIHTNHTEAYDEMRNRDEKGWGEACCVNYLNQKGAERP